MKNKETMTKLYIKFRKKLLKNTYTFSPVVGVINAKKLPGKFLPR
jgi:hypothetical protein